MAPVEILTLLIYYIKLKSHLSVHLSVCSFWSSESPLLVHVSTSNLLETKHLSSKVIKFILKA